MMINNLKSKDVIKHFKEIMDRQKNFLKKDISNAISKYQKNVFLEIESSLEAFIKGNLWLAINNEELQ